jgi:hypothetical protein
MHHIKKQGIAFQTKFNIILADLSFPSRQKIHHPSRHYPLYPKQLKNHNPQLSCGLTIKKNMIQGFLTSFTRRIPIYHYDVRLAEIIQSESCPKGSCLSEEGQPLKGVFILQMLFQGKMESPLGRTL